MKKSMVILSFLIILIFISSPGIAAKGNSRIIVSMDNKKHSVREVPVLMDGQAVQSQVPTFIHKDYTFVPIRFISEQYGAKVEWDEKTQTAIVIQEDKEIRMTINSKDVYINGEKKVLDNKNIPKLVTFPNKDSRTMVPLRFVSETLGYEVGWDEFNKVPFINTLSKMEEDINESTDIGEITDIVVKREDSRPKVIINGTKELKYSTLFLENPSRLVIDIDNSKLNFKDTTIFDRGLGSISVDINPIDKVSFSQFSIEPNVVRVVIHLYEKVDFDISYIEEGKSLELSFKDQAISIPEVDLEEDHLQEDEEIRRDLKEGEDIKPEDRLIILDPGHGGKDPGAISPNGIHEKDVVLTISEKLNNSLQTKGYNTLMIRDGDYFIDKYDRPKIANKIQADIYISIHANAVEENPNVSGIEILYCPTDSEMLNRRNNYELAKTISEELINNLEANDRGLVKAPNTVVLRDTKMPAILIEVGFLTNPIEEKLIQDEDYQEKMVESIIIGIEKYFCIY